MLPTHRKPTRPGKILLEEFLIPLRISQYEFAKHLGGSWTQQKLNAIITGKRSVTEEIALDFADALGTSPEFWIGLQTDVHLWEAGQKIEKLKDSKLCNSYCTNSMGIQYPFYGKSRRHGKKNKEHEEGLVNHIQKFLLELGQGFAFVGRQVYLTVGDQDFYIDLLF